MLELYRSYLCFTPYRWGLLVSLSNDAPLWKDHASVGWPAHVRSGWGPEEDEDWLKHPGVWKKESFLLSCEVELLCLRAFSVLTDTHRSTEPQTRLYRHLVGKPAEQICWRERGERKPDEICFLSWTTWFMTPPVGPSKASQTGRMFFYSFHFYSGRFY